MPGLLDDITQGLKGAGNSLMDYAQSPQGQMMGGGLIAAGAASMDPGHARKTLGQAAQKAAVLSQRENQLKAQHQVRRDEMAQREKNSPENVAKRKQQAFMTAVASELGIPAGSQIDFAKVPQPILAKAMMKVDAMEGVSMLPQGQKPETYGQPVAGVGPDGKPAFMRPGNRGSMKPVENFRPAPPKPPAAQRPTLKEVMNTKTGQRGWATPEQILASPGTYQPISKDGAAKNVAPRNFVNKKTGEVRVVDLTDRAAFNDLLKDDEWVLDVKGATPNDPTTDLQTISDKKAAKDAGKQVAGYRDTYGQTITRALSMGSALDKLHELGGGVTGYRGAIVRNSGVLDQLIPGLGTELSKVVSGNEAMTPAKAKAFGLRAREIIAQSMAQITGEDSARYTDVERKMVEAAVALADPRFGDDEIKASLNTLISGQLVIADYYRIRGQMPEEYDLSNRKNWPAAWERFWKLGFHLDKDTMADTLRRIQLGRENLSHVYKR